MRSLASKEGVRGINKKGAVIAYSYSIAEVGWVERACPYREENKDSKGCCKLPFLPKL